MSKKELYQAVTDHDWQAVDDLISKAPDLLRQPLIRKSLLNYAVEHGHLDQVQSLVARGLSVDFCEGCDPPIATAIEKGAMDILQWLLDNGANVNVSPGGKPLIYTAIHSGSKEIVALLVEHDADLNCPWGVWESPLANALAGDSDEITKFLASRYSLSKEAVDGLAATVKSRINKRYEKKLTESDLKRVENELGLTIPTIYKAFLADFPDDLVTENNEGIYHSADLIIESTKASRAYKEEDWDAPYPDNLIDIGWNGGGSVYCVRAGEEDDRVYLFEHERGDIASDETLTLEEFVAFVRSWYEE